MKCSCLRCRGFQQKLQNWWGARKNFTWSPLILYFLPSLSIPTSNTSRASLLAQMVRNLPTSLETWVSSLSWEDPLKKEMATHSSVLAWEVPWTEESVGPQSMGYSRQEYWSGLPFPCSGDLPNPGIESISPAFQADALPSKPPGKPITDEHRCKNP